MVRVALFLLLMVSLVTTVGSMVREGEPRVPRGLDGWHQIGPLHPSGTSLKNQRHSGIQLTRTMVGCCCPCTGCSPH